MIGPSNDPASAWLQSSAATEASLVGCLLTMSQTVGVAFSHELEPRHFCDESLGIIWSRIRDVTLRGDVPDIQTVLQAGIGTIFGAGTTANEAQARLLADAISPTLVGQYCRLVKSNWALRQIIGQADAAKANLVNADATQLVERLLAEVDEIRDVTLDRKGARRGSLGAVAVTVAEDARAMLAGVGQRPPGTGLVTLDRHLPMRGLAPGALIILAGRTGMGKTMLASSIAGKVARAGHGVATFSLEVPATEIAARIMAEAIGGKSPSYGDILAGLVTEDDLDQIEWERDRVKELPFYLDDTPALSMADMMVTTRREATRFDRIGKPLRLVVVDHAQIVKPSSRYSGNRVGELGEVANAAKVMAKQLGCAVILGCQVNRSSEGRDDKRPTLSDLRASGEIEEAADAVLMLYREAYYLAKSKGFQSGDFDVLNDFERCKNHVEVGVEKSRQGSTGRITLWCDPARSIVADLAPEWRG